MENLIHEKSAIDVKVDFIQKDIEEIKGSLVDVGCSLKDITKAFTKLAAQEEKVAAACMRIDKIELSTESAWSAIRDIKTECLKRQPQVDWAIDQQKHPAKPAQNWWDEKVGQGTEKIFWSVIGGIATYLAMRMV